MILTINDQPLGTVAELRQFVQASEGAALGIGIFRGGKKNSVTLQPERRPPCDELDPIILNIGPDDELDDNELEEFRRALESMPGASHRQILVFRQGVVLKKVSHDNTSTPDTRSKQSNTPNGAPPHLKLKDITEEAVLIETAEFENDQLLSGCCMKLLEFIGEQIKTNSERLEQLLETGRDAKWHQDLDPLQAALADEDRAKLDRLILKLEMKLKRYRKRERCSRQRLLTSGPSPTKRNQSPANRNAWSFACELVVITDGVRRFSYSYSVRRTILELDSLAWAR